MAIDGKWKIVTKTPMGPQEATADVLVTGGVLTGDVSSALGDAKIEDGRVEGDQARWTVNVTSPMALTLKYKGIFSGDTVSGDVELGMFGKSTFSGQRV